MTWGAASIGSRSIHSLVMEFEHDYPSVGDADGYTVESITKALRDFVQARYVAEYTQQADRPRMGILVGGYSHLQFFPNEYTIDFSPDADGTITELRPVVVSARQDFGANWFGQTDALARLIQGYDPAAIEELIKRGADLPIVQKWIDDRVSALPLIFDGMPLQDAVDFTNWAVNVVIGRFRFAPGVQTCGGDVDIAVIRPNAFDWAQRKRWSLKE